MSKYKNLVKQVNQSNQAIITKIVHKPLALIPRNGTEGKFETTIQGKRIVAYFSKSLNEYVLKDKNCAVMYAKQGQPLLMYASILITCYGSDNGQPNVNTILVGGAACINQP